MGPKHHHHHHHDICDLDLGDNKDEDKHQKHGVELFVVSFLCDVEMRLT